VRNLLRRRLLRRVDLSRITEVPEPLRFPLQRDGVDPVARLDEVRDDGPIHRLASVFGLRVWMVSGAEENRLVLADSEHYSTDIRRYAGREGATGAQAIGGLGFTDPPDHTRLRRLLTPEFTRHRLARLQPRIDAIVEERLDAMAAPAVAGEAVDLVEHFAFPVPFQVICELLGVAPEDRDLFRRLAHSRFDVSQGGLAAFGAMSQSRDFLLESAARQRVEPRDGLIGALIEQHGDDLSDDELAGLADGVFTGGYETSASMIALSALTLAASPEVRGQLARDTDPTFGDAVVEELLRYLSVVQIAFPRFVKAPFEAFGQRLQPGDVVICSLSGANRDDALVGGGAGRFDPGRHAGRPLTSHLAFGYGMHRCIGAELGRMELRSAVPRLVRRFPDLELAVPANEVAFRDLSIVFGVDALPVRLQPGSGRSEDRESA
jgi:cytochrome P450